MTSRVKPVDSEVLRSNFSSFCKAFTALPDKISKLFTSKQASLTTLPVEMLTTILYLVEQPGRTAQVCKLWHTISTSKEFYIFLLQRYRACPALAANLPVEATCKTEPEKAVNFVFSYILEKAEKSKIDVQKIANLCKQTHIYSTTFLRQVLELHNQEQLQLHEKALGLWIFCQCLYLEYIPFPAMDDEKVIEHFESRIDATDHLYRTKTSLSLPDFEIAYLTPKIGRLTAITSLCLRGNRFEKLPLELKNCRALESLDIGQNPELSVENVREICKNLPLLRSVIIENTNLKMLKMFEAQLPHVSICRLIFNPAEPR